MVIQGALSGTETPDARLSCRTTRSPTRPAFRTFGNPELTTATGGFTFTLLDSTLSSQFRVVTTTNPPVLSPVVADGVAVNVTSRIAKGRRRGFVRFYGTVTPAENGAQIAILHITHGHGVLVGGTVLKTRYRPPSSKFSREIKVVRGVYRIGARVLGAGQVSNYATPMVIR